MENRKNIIELKNINKSFGKHAIYKDFNLVIKEGEFVGIVGRSGGGKTTLLNMIGCIESYDSGEIIIKGVHKPVIQKKSGIQLLRNEISFLFQNFALVDDCTVDQNLEIVQKYVRQTKAEKDKKRREALQRVGLAGYGKRKVYELSGGEQQRLAIARVMLKPTSILLADEPTGSLDTENKQMVVALLKEINKQGITVIIVTHDEWVANSCERVVRI